MSDERSVTVHKTPITLEQMKQKCGTIKMRSRENIKQDLTFLLRTPGGKTDHIILEVLLDIRELLISDYLQETCDILMEDEDIPDIGSVTPSDIPDPYQEAIEGYGKK